MKVLNGLLTRDDWKQAVKKIPLGIIPAGSGNGLAAFLGVLDPLDAAFAIVKGSLSKSSQLSRKISFN